MFPSYKRLLFLLIFLFSYAGNTYAFWMWTPETNQWINPKFAVKDTPKEQFDLAMQAYDAKQFKESSNEFEKLLKHYPRSVEAPDAQFYIAKIIEDDGDFFAAYKEYQKVVDRYPFSERSAEVIQRQYDIGVKLLNGEQTKGKIRDAITGGADYNIIEVFRSVIKNAPYGPLAAVSQYKIGLYLEEKQLYPEARDEFEKVINDYPNSEWIKPAQYQIAVCDSKRSTRAAYDQKVTQSAVDEFEEFVEIYPDAELSGNAKTEIQKLRDKEAENNFVIAQFYEKQKQYQSAKLYYQTVVDKFPNSPWASKSLNKIRQMIDKKQ